MRQLEEAEYDRLMVLDAAVREAVTLRFDLICWRDLYEALAKLVGVKFESRLLSKESFLSNCAAFHASLATGTQYKAAVREIVLELDNEDFDSIQGFLADYQRTSRKIAPNKPTILPDGDSNLAGAIMAECVRELLELRVYFKHDHPTEEET